MRGYKKTGKKKKKPWTTCWQFSSQLEGTQGAGAHLAGSALKWPRELSHSLGHRANSACSNFQLGMIKSSGALWESRGGYVVHAGFNI